MSKSIGQRIRELRELKRLTQTDLAKRIGCAPNTIAGWEGSLYRAPSKKLLGKVAQALDVSIDYLLNLEKIQSPQIPCYGAFSSSEFLWPTNGNLKHYIEITAEDYLPSRFALQILDDLLEPIVTLGDYAVFERMPPQDGDIIAVRFPDNNNKAMVKRWRQWKKSVMLLESNPYKVSTPYFFHIYQALEDRLTYIIKLEPRERLIVEGKLVVVKRKSKDLTYYKPVT
jgi:transcriptional regulator with XRE-family HTH domain